jgi:small-conductance mechanosensitive channel
LVPVIAEPPFVDQLRALWSDGALWLTTHSARIGVATVMSAALTAILYALRLLGQRLLKPKPSSGHWRGIVGGALSRTRFWFMVAVAAQIVAAIGRAPEPLAGTLHSLFIIATTLQAAVWAKALILGIVEYRAGEADPGDNLSSAVGIIRLLVTVTLFILAGILILSNLGVNVTGLLAGLGIGGIAIGLAAQGIFSDLFAALSILFDRPFRRGDIVRWETTIGIVEAIGLKSTRIRAQTGEEIIVSNANLLGKELHNHARVTDRRVIQTLSLVYHTPPETCAAIPGLVEGMLNALPKTRFVRCGLDSFAASSLDFVVHYDLNVERIEDVLECKHAVNLAILALFAERGIAFAYPTQTTYTAGPDGTLVMPYAQIPLTAGVIQRKK